MGKSEVDKLPCVRFNDEIYVLIGGALAKPDDFAHGRASYAHIFGEDIVRFGQVIGKKNDLVGEGEMEVNVPDVNEALAGIFTDPSWGW